MSKIANVVDGEASESDSEIEVGKSPDAESPDHAKSFVIAGEAPESDDESKISVQKSKEPDLPLYGATVSPPSSPSNIYTSLLHQKLWENNVLLRATLEGLIKHTTEISVEKLTRADKILLNVQDERGSEITG